MSKSKNSTYNKQYDYVKLSNSLATMDLSDTPSTFTYPVSVPYAFYQSVMKLEEMYSTKKVYQFRKNSHKKELYHVTPITLRLMITISRFFNTEGWISGVSIHTLYLKMIEEYEESCSKEQFYAEFDKLQRAGIIVKEVDGIVDRYSIAKEVMTKHKNFIIFSPVVFTKAFTSLSSAAQKLYFELRASALKTTVSVTRIVHSGCWLYRLTHKTRPVQIKKLVNELSKCVPFEEAPLVTHSSFVKNELDGSYSLKVTLNQVYLLKHKQGRKYKKSIPAKIPYKDTTRKLRMYAAKFAIPEINQESNRLSFLKLVKMLHRKGKAIFQYVFNRLKELAESLTDYNMIIDYIDAELKSPQLVEYIDILKKEKLYSYLSLSKEDDPQLRAGNILYFYRRIHSKVSLDSFREICSKAFEQIESFIVNLQYKEKLKAANLRRLEATGRMDSDQYRILNAEDNTFYLDDYLLSLA